MKVAVASIGETLDSEVSEQFGRCPYFLIVDLEKSGEVFAFANPARDLPGGAGPAAVQAIAEHGAKIAVAGKVGPKADQALKVAGIRFVAASGSVRSAIESSGVQAAG